MRRMNRDERGITGLETAIILIAFVVVATVFAFIVLTTGIFSAERGKETVYAGLQKARILMVLDMKQVLKPEQWDRLVRMREQLRERRMDRFERFRGRRMDRPPAP